MARPITAVGVLASMPEYQETPSGKLACLTVTVTTKHRVPQTDDWVTDPPVTHQLLVTDDQGLALVASLVPGDRVLFSGTLRDDAASAIVEAESVDLSERFSKRT